MIRMQYLVVMIDYGRRGREAIVDPEITRREVVSRGGQRSLLSARFCFSAFPRSAHERPTLPHH